MNSKRLLFLRLLVPPFKREKTSKIFLPHVVDVLTKKFCRDRPSCHGG